MLGRVVRQVTGACALDHGPAPLCCHMPADALPKHGRLTALKPAPASRPQGPPKLPRLLAQVRLRPRQLQVRRSASKLPHQRLWEGEACRAGVASAGECVRERVYVCVRGWVGVCKTSRK